MNKVQFTLSSKIDLRFFVKLIVSIICYVTITSSMMLKSMKKNQLSNPSDQSINHSDGEGLFFNNIKNKSEYG